MTAADLRRDYALTGLTEADAAADPFAQFAHWFDQALAAGLPEPNAMTLATATSDGRPSARIVLLKGFDARGFVFFTNRHSRKGRELAANPRAALVFFWPELERQVRVEGNVAPTGDDESDAYFASRPLASRLGAWASPQSETIAGREALDRNVAALTARFGGNVPRPPHWGGYRVVPEAVEFWQGRPSRLHDRLRYIRRPGDRWLCERLAP